jgi:hypothetical protein
MTEVKLINKKGLITSDSGACTESAVTFIKEANRIEESLWLNPAHQLIDQDF